jgi:tripartite ATP-independent transporter DctM subunit
MNVGLLTAILFGSLLILLALGFPLTFSLGGIAFLGLGLTMGFRSASLVVVGRFNEYTMSFIYMSIPMFIFMSNMLERSGIAEDLYVMMYRWIGRLKGGLAMGTVVISTIMAAMVGLSSAATVTMGVTALPSMIKRGYSKHIAIGSIAAGGTLGILIPPSIIMITYAMTAQVSVARLWVGGVLPGLLLSAIFLIYIAVRCYLQPFLGPGLPLAERANWRERLVSLLSVILPVLLVVLVLGSIFFGIATPTEAAAVGAAGSILCAGIYRKLNWKNLSEASFRTLRLTCMIFWILAASISFRSLYSYIGATQFLEELLLVLPFGRWGVMVVIQLTLLFLGCLLDPYGIVMIAVPVFAPVLTSLGFDLLWFGILFVINMEMGYLTPPVGLNLFYMKGVVPEGVTTGDIYRAVAPFVLLQGAGLIVVMLIPQLATWLPGLLFK